MSSILGIINLNERENKIKELTYHRPIASIPIMGRYRIIDFVLSNMVNSGISAVLMFTRLKYRSLLDHVRGGLPWDLDRGNKGLYIFNPMQNIYSNVRSGDMDIIRDHMDYIYYDKSDYVVVSPSYMVCNIDYRDVLDFHRHKNADITLMYKPTDKGRKEFEGCPTIVVGDDGEAIDILYSKRAKRNVFMEMYVMKRGLFLDILNRRVLGADHDLFMDTVMHLKSNLKIFAYEYNGYLSCINSIGAYYRRSMELLDEEIMDTLFDPYWPIFTKVKNEPPTKYEGHAQVYGSRIAGGTIIDGHVEDSVVFRKVEVGHGATVKHSILMQNSKVHEDATVEYAILDKNVVITKGKTVKGTEENPAVVEKGQII